MLLAYFNRKEHLRHRAVSLRQHGFLVAKYCAEIGIFSSFLLIYVNIATNSSEKNCQKTTDFDFSLKTEPTLEVIQHNQHNLCNITNF